MRLPAYIKAILLALGLVSLVFSYHEPLSVNDGSRFATVDSLIHRHTFRIDDSPYRNQIDTVFFKGNYFSDKPPLLAAYSAAIYTALQAILPLNLWIKPFPHYLSILTSVGISWIVLCFLMVYAYESIGIKNASVVGPAVAGTLFGTLILSYATVYHSHVIEAMLVFGVFYLIIRYRLKRFKDSSIYAGLLSGVLIMLNPLTIIYSFGTAIFFLTESLRAFAK